MIKLRIYAFIIIRLKAASSSLIYHVDAMFGVSVAIFRSQSRISHITEQYPLSEELFSWEVRPNVAAALSPLGIVLTPDPP